jgi:hypothetical protein
MQYAQQLHSNGIALIQPLLSPAEAADMRSLVHRIYDLLSEREIDDEFLRDHFNRWHGVWMKPLPKFLQENDLDIFNSYENLLRFVSGKAKSALGDEWTLLPQQSFFRRHVGVRDYLPWHIDADAAALGDGRCMNVWIPLDAVGTNRPSLELVPNSSEAMRKLPLIVEGERVRDDAFVRTIGPSIVPLLDFGDAVAFDSYTLHRTQQVTETSMRTACEFRFSG